MVYLGRIVIAIALLFSLSAYAEKPLTGAQIEKFMSSMEEIQKWSEKNEHRFKSDDDSDDGFDLSVDKIMREMREAKAYDEIEDIVEKHGFSSPEEWAGIMVRVSKAMMAEAMSGMKDYQAQMNAQVESMMKDPNIPEEQKQAMQQMMQQTTSIADEIKDVNPADVAAVKPYMEKLQAQMMEEGD
ncbi:MAG: hypothetical protein H7A01_06795 [Hahellaceae bacterium]|nr:hypothetical protein [Hahellaceae bacterium]MCP5211779.1 hypothetical protein [Hahellaceae bacterium]